MADFYRKNTDLRTKMTFQRCFKAEKADFKQKNSFEMANKADEGGRGGTDGNRKNRPVWNHRSSAPPEPLPKNERGHVREVIGMKKTSESDVLNIFNVCVTNQPTDRPTNQSINRPTNGQTDM